MPARILVVDDESSVRSLLQRVLEQDSYDVTLASNGQDALGSATSHPPDLMVLDLNLPDMNGEEICQTIRSNPRIQGIPILVLTGRNTPGLSTQTLNLGADDYLAKPFDVPEFLAHIRALLRRPRIYTSEESVIQRGGISIHVAEHRVFYRGELIQDLAPKEFEVLRHLVVHAPKVLDKNTLALKAWGQPLTHLHQRTLDVHIRRIRQKLGTAAPHLKTIPAVGYQWVDDLVI